MYRRPQKVIFTLKFIIKYFIFFIFIFLTSLIGLWFFKLNPSLFSRQPTIQKITQELPQIVLPTQNLVIKTPSPTSSPSITKDARPTSKPLPTADDQPWGVSKQISQHTWTMKVGMDPSMATPQEILQALNQYRIKHGSQPLTVDPKLAQYAQSRADSFDAAGTTDEHQGFNDFLENQDGFQKLSFTWLGENTSIGYRMNGVHLIEWIYAGDEPHDKNQLDNKWSHIGIGVKGTATCLIFATGKM